MRTTFHYPESPYGRTYADVITKISQMDSLPNYLGAPLARASRARSSAKKCPPQHNRKQNRYSQTPVSDHPESEGLVHGRVKESAWDLIQEEVWVYVPLERKLIACSMCIYVFSERFLHTPRVA